MADDKKCKIEEIIKDINDEKIRNKLKELY